MKKIFAVLIIALLSVCVWAAETSSMVTAEADVADFFVADECYVLFLLEGGGGSMAAAKENFDRKYHSFSAVVEKSFPQAAVNVIAVNYGNRSFSSYRALSEHFAPCVAKVLIFTIPPDENMAMALLDSGIKAGLTPFCGISRDGSFGAVFFGVKNPERKIRDLCNGGVKKLRVLAESMAKLMSRKVTSMSDIIHAVRPEHYELRFKDIKVELPGKFCSADMNRVKIAVALRGSFSVGN